MMKTPIECEWREQRPSVLVASSVVTWGTGRNPPPDSGPTQRAFEGWPHLLREWIRTDLEPHRLSLRSLTAFDVPRRLGRVTRPDTPTFPSGLWIVDPPVCRPWKEPQWIWDAQNHPLAGLRHQCYQRAGIDREGYRHVIAKPQRVIPVNFAQVVHISVDVRVAEGRALPPIDLPTFGTLPSGSCWPVQHFALGTIEARQMVATPPIHPDHALVIDVYSTRSKYFRLSPWRRLVDLGSTRLRRVRASTPKHDRHIERIDPYTPGAFIDWANADRVAPEIDSVVLVGIDWVVGFSPRLCDFAITVGVEHGWNPTLRGLVVMGLVIDFGVDPADSVVLAKEQAAIGSELVMIRRKACVDLCDLRRCRIVERNLFAAGVVQRKVLGKFVRRATLAEIWLVCSPNLGREPCAS